MFRLKSGLKYLIIYHTLLRTWAGIAWSVQCLAMDWMVQGSNPGGSKIFCQSKHNRLLYNCYFWVTSFDSQVIFRPYKEQIQGYLSVSCTLGSQALTKYSVIIITVHFVSTWDPRVHDALR